MPGENLTRVEAAERSDLIHTHSYLVELDLTTSEETFRCITTVKFDAKAGSSSFIDAITAKVYSIKLNGEDLDVALADGVRIALPNLAAENTLVIDADMHYMHTGEGLHRYVDPADGEVYLYTQFEVPDSRRMFPVFEQPDLKATFEFHVTAPSHWAVVSNQPTPEPTAVRDGVSRWNFKPTPRLSSYVTALIAGPYSSKRGSLTSSDGRIIPLGVFARKSMEDFMDAEYFFEKTTEAFAFYEKTFSYPYPFEKYDQLYVPEFNSGAMENAGAVTFNEQYLFRSVVPESLRERRVVTIVHELAHMWFGDLVTMKWWNDLWLNESFAEYTSHLGVAEATEWKDAWTTFAFSEKAWAYTQDQLPSTHPVVAPINDLEDVQVNFDGITYAKGASVLKLLGAYVGRENFERGVGNYFKKHEFKNAVLSDLLDELEAASGRELKSWSKLWLETAGVNTLHTRVESENGKITKFAVEQTTPAKYPTLRPHLMGIGFYNMVGDELVRTHRIEVDIDGALTDIPELVGLDRPSLILLNDEDLTYAKLRLDAESMKFAVDNLSKLRDPLARSLVWGCAWDATRDGEGSARDFIDLILNNLGEEDHGTTLTTVLRQLLTTVKIYTDPARRHDAIVDAFARLIELARKAKPGSNNQLMFVKFATYFAEIPEHGDILEGLYRGTEVIPGLAIDADMKWDLMNGIVMEGRYGLKEIEELLAQDDTANGSRQAIMARMSIRTAEAKEAGFKEIAYDESLSNYDVMYGSMGLIRNHDTKLLVPMVDWYFEAALHVWNTRTFKIADHFLVNAYPFFLATQDLADKTRAFAAKPEIVAIPALHRIMIENLDVVERALRAQKVDR